MSQEQPTAEVPRTLSVDQAAKVLGVSRGTCYELVNSGRLHSIQIGRRRLIPRAAVLNFVGEAPPREPVTEGSRSGRPWFASDPEFLWNALQTIESACTHRGCECDCHRLFDYLRDLGRPTELLAKQVRRGAGKNRTAETT